MLKVSINQLLKSIIVPVNNIPSKKNKVNRGKLAIILSELGMVENENSKEILLKEIDQLEQRGKVDEILSKIEIYLSAFSAYETRERKAMVADIARFLSVSSTFTSSVKGIDFSDIRSSQRWEDDSSIIAFLIAVIAQSRLRGKKQRLSYYGLLKEANDSSWDTLSVKDLIIFNKTKPFKLNQEESNFIEDMVNRIDDTINSVSIESMDKNIKDSKSLISCKFMVFNDKRFLEHQDFFDVIDFSDEFKKHFTKISKNSMNQTLHETAKIFKECFIPKIDATSIINNEIELYKDIVEMQEGINNKLQIIDKQAINSEEKLFKKYLLFKRIDEKIQDVRKIIEEIDNLL